MKRRTSQLFDDYKDIATDDSRAWISDPSCIGRTDADGNTPLHVACVLNDARTTAELLLSGASIDSVNYAGQTPITLTFQRDAELAFGSLWRYLLCRCGSDALLDDAVSHYAPRIAHVICQRLSPAGRSRSLPRAALGAASKGSLSVLRTLVEIEPRCRCATDAVGSLVHHAACKRLRHDLEVLPRSRRLTKTNTVSARLPANTPRGTSWRDRLRSRAVAKPSKCRRHLGGRRHTDACRTTLAGFGRVYPRLHPGAPGTLCRCKGRDGAQKCGVRRSTGCGKTHHGSLQKLGHPVSDIDVPTSGKSQLGRDSPRTARADRRPAIEPVPDDGSVALQQHKGSVAHSRRKVEIHPEYSTNGAYTLKVKHGGCTWPTNTE